jgi:hypothetical protein
MSFGLKNAGATYQRAIQMCFADQLHQNVEAYVDDVVIKTRNPKDLLLTWKKRLAAYDSSDGSSTQQSAYSEYHQGNCLGSLSATEELKPVL